ncbi:MAG: DUF1552 domain-containing protein [Polyangiaceae bacterium]|nr:DUF1552 domain-containing protein [Polyangiaceae bacterium]
MALRGAVSGAAVAIWLPVLDAMTNEHGESFAQGEPLPTTFGVFFWGNGVQKAHWTPEGAPGAGWALPRNLVAFEPIKHRLTLLTGLKMLDGGQRGHGAGVLYVLCGGNHSMAVTKSDIDFEPYGFERHTSTQSIPTIDQIVADDLEKRSPSTFRSLETGALAYRGMNMGTVSTALAHRGPYDVLPPERDPVALYDRLFSGLGSPASAIVLQMHKSSLDAVRDDLERLKMQVGAVDAARVDRHMEGIREIESRLVATGRIDGNCQPSRPGVLGEDGMLLTQRSQAINRLVGAALGCNLTRVYTHLWSGARDDNTYPILGINIEHHGLTHDGPASNLLASDIERYIMEQYADLAIVLDQTPMGASTLLDRTINFGVTEVADPATHVHEDYHLLVVGGGAGRIKGDQFLVLQGRKITEVQLTLLQTMGLNITEWGNWDHTMKTVPELLT